MSKRNRRERETDTTSDLEYYEEYPDITVQQRKNLISRTENQKNYIRTMVESDVTICTGPAGCGKSFCSTGLAVEHLVRGKVQRIMFSRPIVNCGAGLGFLPGDVSEKVMPYFAPISSNLEYFLGIKQMRYLMGMGVIQFEPLETMRGASIKDTFLVVDEVSNCTYKQIKMVLSRIDEGSKFVLQGDPSQCDLPYCEFMDAYNRLSHGNIQGLGVCELDEFDIQRPKIVRDIMKVMG